MTPPPALLNTDVLSAIMRRQPTIYGDLHRQGALISDADILIAASALENGLTVISNNESHFARIPGLLVDNWLKE